MVIKANKQVPINIVGIMLKGCRPVSTYSTPHDKPREMNIYAQIAKELYLMCYH